MNIVNWQDVIDFWFHPDNVPNHFSGGEDFDNEIRERFLDTWKAGSEGLLFSWRENIKGRLAEIIVLDQFSRNLWRDDIRTYTQDKMAIALAQETIDHPDYDKLSSAEKRFILLPFMHSESLELHDWAKQHFLSLNDDGFMYYENMHRAVLEEFGRYPYQNVDLGRESTPEELKSLQENSEGYYS